MFSIKRIPFSAALTLGMIILAGCAGSKNDNNNAYLPAGCVAGQPCNYNALAAGSAVVYQGQVNNINSDLARTLALAQNGNVYAGGVRYGLANLTITGQGNATGGTTYNINLTIQPVQTNIFGFCMSLQSSCTNPIIITGNAAYYPMSDGTQWLILQYGGIKLEVIAANINASTNAFNGTVPALSDVQVKVVRPGRDFLQGELLGTAYLTTYQVGAGYYNGPLPSNPNNYITPSTYTNPYPNYPWGW